MMRTVFLIFEDSQEDSDLPRFFAALVYVLYLSFCLPVYWYLFTPATAHTDCVYRQSCTVNSKHALLVGKNLLVIFYVLWP